MREKTKNGLKIISIGRLTHQKDHITLFEALNMYKNIYNSNFKLYLIGSGYNLKLLSDFIHDNKLLYIIIYKAKSEMVV